MIVFVLVLLDLPAHTRPYDPRFDFVFVYWHLLLVTPDGPRFRSTFLPRLPLASWG